MKINSSVNMGVDWKSYYRIQDNVLSCVVRDAVSFPDEGSVYFRLFDRLLVRIRDRTIEEINR